MNKVLVIDDEKPLRTLLCKAIAAFGYAVREAEDGRAGVALCGEWKPDVILTDIFMPEQDGLETLRMLRKTLPEARVIAMSGGGNMGDLDVLRTARILGAVMILPKPFELAILKKTLREILPPNTSVAST